MRLQNIFNLLSGSALVFGCRLFGAAIVFATQLMLARGMGAHELGIYVLAFSWCLLLSTVAGLGFPAASLRFIGESLGKNNPGQIKGFIRHSRRTVIVSSSIAALVAIAVIYLAGNRISDDYVVPFIVAMACMPLVTLQRLQDKIAHAYSWIALAFVPSMALRPLLFLLCVAAVTWSSASLTSDSAMILQCVAVLLVLLMQYFLLAPKLRSALGDVEEEYGKALWARTAIPLLISTLFVQYFPELSVTLIGMLLPAADVAIFYTCFRIALFIAFGLTAVNALLAPQISKLYATQDLTGLRLAVARTTQVKFIGALIAFVLLIIFGEIVLGWFGEEFRAGYATLIILAAGQLVLAVAGPVDMLLNLTGHQDRCLIAFSSALPVAIILNLLLVPLMGINGAAIAVFLTTIFWNIWLYSAVVATLKIHPSLLHSGIFVRG